MCSGSLFHKVTPLYVKDRLNLVNLGCLVYKCQRWPGISGTDPALNQRVVNSYFRYWYYVRVKWATPILVITER